MNISNTQNINVTEDNIIKKGEKSEDNINNKKNIQNKEFENKKEMSLYNNIIQQEGNSTENSDRNYESTPSNSNSNCNEDVSDDFRKNDINNEEQTLSNNKPSLMKSDTLLDELGDIASETTTTTLPTKNVANRLIKDLLAHSISSKDSQKSSLQDNDYRPLLLSVTEDDNSSINSSLINPSHFAYKEGIKNFLKKQGIVNFNENEYEEEISDEDNMDLEEYEEEDNDDDDVEVDVDEEDDEEYEEYEDDEEDDDEDDEDDDDDDDDDDDIETEFLDSEYEFDNYPTYGYSGDYELNKSLGVVPDESMGEYEYKNMIDVLRNLSYVVSKMRNERDTEKLSIKNFDSIMNEIKYSQKTCSEILLKAERISNKYTASLKELNGLQEKFKKQNEQYKEEINQMNKRIQILRNEIKNNNIKGKLFNTTEKWTNIILITIVVVTIYTFLFLLMSHFNVQQYTKPFVDRCISYCSKISLNHDFIRVFNKNFKYHVNSLYNSYEHFVLKAIDAIQNMKIS